MTKTLMRWAVGATVSGGLAIASATAAPTPDLKSTASTLVSQCANIKQGDLVFITGTPRDTELLENIAVNVRALGAFPLISVETDTLARRMFDETPAKYDTQAPEFSLKLAGLVSATISVDSTDNIGLFAGAAPDRMAAREKAMQPIMETMLKRNVRQVSLGNGLYPTASLAKQYGISQDDLANIFWAAVNTDYSTLQATGDTVKAALAAGNDVHITNPNGTDLKFKISSRPVFVSDGVISTQDASKGGPACQVWLPAGEVYSAPVAGSAEGKVVVDRMFFQGKEITGLNLTFRGGKLTEMTAKNGIEPLKAMYDAAGQGKDAFAFFDIGINESLKVPQNSKLLSWIPAGMVTIGVGNNTWAGGTNDTSFSLSGFLPGSTLMVDTKTLIENGRLKQ